jgi:hypothetical protein
MLLFFATCSLSVFLPYSATDRLAFALSKGPELTWGVGNHSTVVILAAPHRDSVLINALGQAQPLFPDAHMMYGTDTDVIEWLNGTQAFAPFLVFVEHGTTQFVIGQILDETTMLTVIDLHITHKRVPVSTQEEMVGSFSLAPITLLTTESQFRSCVSIAEAAGEHIGPVNVITLVSNLARGIQLEDGACAIFRKHDQVLEAFDCTFDTFQKLSRPSHSLADRYFQRWNETLVVFRTRSEQTPEFGETFWKIGENFRELRFIIIKSGSEEEKAVSDFLGQLFGISHSNVAIINFNGGYYWDLSGFFTFSMLDVSPFNHVEFGNQLVQALFSLRAGSLTKLWRSEADPEPVNDSIIQKVTTRTYDQYINEPDKDVLMLFISPESYKSSDLLSRLRSISEDLVKKNVTTYKFGYLDVVKNRREKEWPVPEACAIIWPASNKSDPKILPVSSTGALSWFVRKYSSFPIDMEEKVPEDYDVTCESCVINFTDPDQLEVAERVKAELLADILIARPPPTPTPTPDPDDFEGSILSQRRVEEDEVGEEETEYGEDEEDL